MLHQLCVLFQFCVPQQKKQPPQKKTKKLKSATTQTPVQHMQHTTTAVPSFFGIRAAHT